MSAQYFQASNDAHRFSSASGLTRIDQSQPSKALLISWEGSPGSDQAEAAEICSALEEGFGYIGIKYSLPQIDPEAALSSQLQSLLKDCELVSNPFVIYYHGNGFIKNGKPFWRLDKNSAAIDWFNIQKILENGTLDTILLINCDYGIVPTMTHDGDGLSAFRLAAPRGASGKIGKLEIIASPQKPDKAQDLGVSFSQALAGAIRERTDSPFSLDRLVTDLQKKLGDAIVYRNLSPIASGGKIKMKPIAILPSRLSRSKASGTRRQSQDTELAVMAQKWNDCSQWSTVLPAREGCYKKVVVQPIAWKVSDWDAEGEIEDLKATFKTHFDYQVEETFLIPDDNNAQEILETKIRTHIDKNLFRALSNNDLLIIIYNGHGMDGYKNNCNMMWIGGVKSKHDILINWTKIVHELDAAPCDVFQVLDCCFGATAIKSKVTDETKMLDHIHEQTPISEYQGKNEILASCGRDNPTAAGRNSSMPLFAEVLKALTTTDSLISVYSWFHEIDSEVVRRNTQNYQDTFYPRFHENWYYSPSWKCHPKDVWPQSIILRPRSTSSAPERRNSSTFGYIYARIKIEQGRPTDVLYSTEKELQ